MHFRLKTAAETRKMFHKRLELILWQSEQCGIGSGRAQSLTEQHGLEDEVILAVDQSDFDFGLASKEAFKSDCGINTSQTSARNQDPFGPGERSFPLTMTVNQG